MHLPKMELISYFSFDHFANPTTTDESLADELRSRSKYHISFFRSIWDLPFQPPLKTILLS